jgi:hypothetical protein
MRPRSPRSRKLVPLASGTQDLAGRLFGRRPEHRILLLQAAWRAAVGPELSRRTEVITMDGRTLRVRVPDAGWRKVLHRMRGDLLARLRDIAGSLAPGAIGFHEGSLVLDVDHAPAPLPAPPQPAAVPAAIESAAAAIADPEIRERFTQSAALYLLRAAGARR